MPLFLSVRVEFRNITLEELKPDEERLKPFMLKPLAQEGKEDEGVVPKADDAKLLNLGFESADLTNWTGFGDAFKNQPIENAVIGWEISNSSFMPTGLLQDLNDRERMELLKSLMSL